MFILNSYAVNAKLDTSTIQHSISSHSLWFCLTARKILKLLKFNLLSWNFVRVVDIHRLGVATLLILSL